MNTDIAVEGWYLENHDDANNHHKYYTVLVADNGVLVFAWGRIGTKGQFKIQKLSSRNDAHTLGMKQFYSKRGRSYEPVSEGVAFTVTSDEVDRACESGDASFLTRQFHTARMAPMFEQDKQAVITHYDDLLTKAQALMDTAGTQNFDAVYGQFEELQATWATLEDKHSETATTVSILSMMLQQRLLTGALS